MWGSLETAWRSIGGQYFNWYKWSYSRDFCWLDNSFIEWNVLGGLWLFGQLITQNNKVAPAGRVEERISRRRAPLRVFVQSAVRLLWKARRLMLTRTSSPFVHTSSSRKQTNKTRRTCKWRVDILSPLRSTKHPPLAHCRLFLSLLIEPSQTDHQHPSGERQLLNKSDVAAAIKLAAAARVGVWMIYSSSDKTFAPTSTISTLTLWSLPLHLHQ